MTNVLAVDIGYGYTKGMTPKTQVLFPSIVGPAEKVRFETDVIVTDGQSIALEVEGRHFFVGEQALKRLPILISSLRDAEVRGVCKMRIIVSPSLRLLTIRTSAAVPASFCRRRGSWRPGSARAGRARSPIPPPSSRWER